MGLEPKTSLASPITLYLEEGKVGVGRRVICLLAKVINSVPFCEIYCTYIQSCSQVNLFWPILVFWPVRIYLTNLVEL